MEFSSAVRAVGGDMSMMRTSVSPVIRWQDAVGGDVGGQADWFGLCLFGMGWVVGVRWRRGVLEK